MALFKINCNTIFALLTVFLCASSEASEYYKAKDLDSPNELMCPNGWMQHGETCYRLLKEKLSWHQSKQRCQSHHSHLVVTADEDTSQYIAAHFLSDSVDSVWIGVNDHMKEGDYVWQGTSISVNYTNWAEGQPESLLPNPKICAYMKQTPGNSWFDGQCDTPRSSICETAAVYTGEAEKVNSTSTSKDSLGNLLTRTRRATGKTERRCKDSDKEFEGECYHGIEAALANWKYAADLCKRYGGNVLYRHLIIRNQYENQFIYNMLAQNTELDEQAWLALRGQYDNNGQIRWLWKDDEDDGGIEANYTNWNTQPNDYPKKSNNQLCVKMIKGGKWEIDDCTVGLNRTMCSLDKATIKPSSNGKKVDCEVPTSAPMLPCSDGWFGVGDQCFKSNMEPKEVKTFDGAQQHCQTMSKSSLAKIKSECLSEKIREQLVGKITTGTALLWIGLKDKGEGLNWMDTEPVNLTNWDIMDDKIEGKCVAWKLEGDRYNSWSQTDCSDKRSYLCELPRATMTTPTTTVTPTKEASTKDSSTNSDAPSSTTPPKNTTIQHVLKGQSLTRKSAVECSKQLKSLKDLVESQYTKLSLTRWGEMPPTSTLLDLIDDLELCLDLSEAFWPARQAPRQEYPPSGPKRRRGHKKNHRKSAREMPEIYFFVSDFANDLKRIKDPIRLMRAKIAIRRSVEEYVLEEMMALKPGRKIKSKPNRLSRFV